ncbi:MAG: hypothetical protein ISR96_07560 [Nitrospira sp.]|nr:hypothetical protein [Nitrospira sp.]
MFDHDFSNESNAAVYQMPSLENEDSTANTQKQLEELQRQAYEEGFATGEKAGYSAGEQKAVVLMERLEKILGEIIAIKEDMITSLEPQVVDLSVAVARKIINEEIRLNPELIITLVREAMKHLKKVGTITIKINPTLKELFVNNRSALTEIHEDIVFDVNPNVPLSGPMVTSETEEVVTDVESMLQNILDEWKGMPERA